MIDIVILHCNAKYSYPTFFNFLHVLATLLMNLRSVLQIYLFRLTRVHLFDYIGIIDIYIADLFYVMSCKIKSSLCILYICFL